MNAYTTTALEQNVAAEIAMLKDLIQGAKNDIEMMINDHFSTHAEINEVRGELAGYEYDLSRIAQ